mmetsp:Transcript_6057/g.13555  ORF Transcript_6057/g.13555 Transcript_6057/m.13555 type:complete len:201 (-) Transcript_6057:119-721(-)
MFFLFIHCCVYTDSVHLDLSCMWSITHDDYIFKIFLLLWNTLNRFRSSRGVFFFLISTVAVFAIPPSSFASSFALGQGISFCEHALSWAFQTRYCQLSYRSPMPVLSAYCVLFSPPFVDPTDAFQALGQKGFQHEHHHSIHFYSSLQLLSVAWVWELVSNLLYEKLIKHLNDLDRYGCNPLKGLGLEETISNQLAGLPPL